MYKFNAMAKRNEDRDRRVALMIIGGRLKDMGETVVSIDHETDNKIVVKIARPFEQRAYFEYILKNTVVGYDFTFENDGDIIKLTYKLRL